MTTHETIRTIIDEMNDTHKERRDVIHSSWVALVGRQHLLMLGPGGTGKSMLTRDIASRILHPDNDQPLWDEYDPDATFNGYFEKALDETSTPDEVFGPPDIKAMVEDGKTRRVVTGMLPEAIVAFLDEFFNSSGPTLHSTMPALNERLFHNNGIPIRIPLWSAFMGTNKLNADADQAALWDRVHIRHVVGYIQDRSSKADMLTAAIKRKSLAYAEPEKTRISFADIQQAHEEALKIPMPEPVTELFFDILDALRAENIIIGDRRIVEGANAVLANAYINGNDEVRSGDLEVLAHMWWMVQDHRAEARSVIMSATNPGEKKALDMLDDLDKLQRDLREVADADNTRKQGVGLEVFKSTRRLFDEAKNELEKAEATGSSTTRLKEVLRKTETLMASVAKDVFGLAEEATARLHDLDKGGLT